MKGKPTRMELRPLHDPKLQGFEFWKKFDAFCDRDWNQLATSDPSGLPGCSGVTIQIHTKTGEMRIVETRLRGFFPSTYTRIGATGKDLRSIVDAANAALDEGVELGCVKRSRAFTFDDVRDSLGRYYRAKAAAAEKRRVDRAAVEEGVAIAADHGILA